MNIKSFMKRKFESSSILAITLMFSLGIMTACASFEKTTNDKTSTGTAQSGSAANNKEQVENKSTENKEPAETQESKSIDVYDGRFRDYQESKSFDEEKSFVGNVLKEKDAAIKKLFKDDQFNCELDFDVRDAAKGSFTKPSSSQTAYLYSQTCLDDTMKYPASASGIIIAENEKVVSHYVFSEIIGLDALRVLPDVNQNGLSELVLTSSGAKAYYTTMADIYEVDSDNLVSLGATEVFTNTPAEGETEGSETAHKITVEPAKSPVFYRETYYRKSDTAKWELKNKSEKISLKKNTVSGFTKIN